jgi:serine/threonine protein kinase
MNCEPTRLQILLTGDEDSAIFREAQRHVDTCPRCQQRLLELSSDSALVKEACETLRADGDLCDEAWTHSAVVVNFDSLQGDDVPIDSETVSLDFLGPPSQPDLLGRLGRYEIERVIGTGGMGIVLKGYDTELHRVVAIKVLLPHLANSGAARRRFAREAQAAAAVVHEHVIPIHNVEAEGDISYLVMQYVPGQSLQARVDEQGPLPVREVLRIARQAALGLAAAHDQGVVHRDVKPANMLLEEKVDRLLISDFGLARTVDDATLTRTGIVAGTPHYMSPEQADGEVVDQRSDLFSLGSVIYFMCTGRPPFRAASPMAVLHRICHEEHRPVDEVNPEVPVELAEVIERLLAKKPGDRFASATEVATRLDELLAELQRGGRLRRRSWARRAVWLWREWRKPALLGLAAVGCLLVGAAVANWWERGEPSGDVGRAHWPVPPPAPTASSALFPVDGFGLEFRKAIETAADLQPGLPPLHAQSNWSDWDREMGETLDLLQRAEQATSGSAATR